MADLLQSLISGADPQAAQELAAYQAERGGEIAQDPSKWSVQEFGPFASLNRMMALGQLGTAQREVGDIARANVGAQPDLAKAYAAPDPYQWAAENPSANPIALARILGGSPTAVATARNAAADAAYRRALASMSLLQAQLRLQALGANPATGAPTPPMPGAAAGAALPPGGVSPFGSGRPSPPPGAADSGATAPTPAPVPGAVAGGLDLSQMPPPGPQRQAWIAGLSTAQKRALIARLRPATAPGVATPAPGQ